MGCFMSEYQIPVKNVSYYFAIFLLQRNGSITALQAAPILRNPDPALRTGLRDGWPLGPWIAPPPPSPAGG